MIYECAICLDSDDENNISNNKIYRHLKCKHIFHKHCMKYINNNLCPICRHPINTNNIFSKFIQLFNIKC